MTAPLELNPQRVAFIGFGEAGQAFARSTRKDRPRINLSAYDIKENDPASRSSLLSAYNAENVSRLRESSEVAGAELVFSTVTADNAYAAAQSLKGANLRGSFFFDCNSWSPQTKRKSAKIIEDLGACYIDSAVMAPVQPGLHNTPLLLSGSKAMEGSERLKSLDFGNVSVVEGGVGGAS